MHRNPSPAPLSPGYPVPRMRDPSRPLLPLLLCALACGGASGSELLVDLRTDLVAGVELGEVSVDLEGEGASLQVYVPAPGDNLVRGVRAAEFMVPGGSYLARARFFAPNGSLVGERRAAITVRGRTSITVVYTRRCADVTCPNGADASATECDDGRCVPPECTPENPEACGGGTCERDEDCPPPGTDCARAACFGNGCFLEVVGGACGPGQACAPDRGCVAVGSPDAGVSDAGADAGCQNDGECDDGQFCNGAERCLEGVCADAEAPVTCDDAVGCTADRCDETLDECVFTPDDGLCTDGPDGRCDPETDCQYPVCTPVTCTAGPCQTAVCEGDLCVRENLCGGSEMCCGGACVPMGCDDGNPCTDDSCGAGGCVNANNTDPCSDGDACTTGDRCGGGSCNGGGALNCNDGNACTDDSCVPATGCRNTNNTRTCDDGNACTTTDRCSGGACVGSGTLNCNDGNVCTDDSCVPATGCRNTNNTRTCDDGNACTLTDRCSGGACVGTGAPDCDDGNLCTDDSCVPATGCRNTNNTRSCDDGNACTDPDQCSGGACTGTPISCNDFQECTSDSCNPASGCVNIPRTGEFCGGCETGTCNSGGTCIGGGCPAGRVCICPGFCGSPGSDCP